MQMQTQARKGDRAVIYIRVSTEMQAKAASPAEQERDCRELAKTEGLTVVHVYYDTEKYRAGGKIVEPSGTRSDRPAFRKMMQDAEKDLFDVIIAWREDRLYRGIIPAALDIATGSKEGRFMVALVNGVYDPRTAMLMAWAGGIENEARNDRMGMGRLAYLREGKWWGAAPFGYMRDPNTQKLVRNPDEDWVVLGICERAAAGQTVQQIRDWLVAINAPQRLNTKGGTWNNYQWAPWSIRQILYRSDDYWRGYAEVKVGDEVYRADMPALVPAHIVKAIQRRRESYKFTKVGNVKKGELLFVGKVYCGVDQIKMQLHRTTITQKNRVQYVYYSCGYRKFQLDWKEGCAGTVRVEAVEKRAWSLVYNEISTPGKLEGMVQARIKEHEARAQDAVLIIKELETKLEKLEHEKNNVVRWARQGMISEAEMALQLGEVRAVVASVQKELTTARLDGNHSIDGLRAGLELLRQDIRGAKTALAHEPLDEEEAALQWRIKKQIIDNFVDRVVITRPEWSPGYRRPKKGQGSQGPGHPGREAMPFEMVVEMSIDMERFVVSGISSPYPRR